ncbi:alpha/beta hydrolase [Novosphingobium sp. PC22D]|uniref:alpha/beta fold hydrolase n=1 Tax=Novosphingobium sp. PC22D TaxID=1962403 RepID=UPI000BFB0305|nr:alpha/beta fold hydrolase [Novosphingobium sp. PC22D]PEQ14054.1 alpha/beta hydrolase [Novosphingobium sp. PC22D]
MTLAREPAAILAELDARARRIETPCGEGSMVWRVWGEGEPLVLGHGAQGSWQHWVRNIDAYVAAGRMVIALDLPGHGDSAMPARSDHAGVAGPMAHGLREILGARLPVDICGFSLSGTAFAYMAAFHPGVARRLVLVGCGGLDTPHGAIDLGRVSGLTGEARRARLKANLNGLMLHDPDSADDLAIAMLLPNAKAARLDISGFVLPDKLLRILPEVAAPVDAIWGEFDRPHPDPAMQEAALRSVRPQAGFRVVEGAGHWAMYERPAAFDAALLGILATPPTG